jgi:hypothetical protein
LRRVSKRWNPQRATVLTQTLGGVWLTTLEIRYQIGNEGESREGVFQRRYLRRMSAETEPVFEAGAEIDVLVDPRNPDRSYFPLPLSGWGLVYAAPFVALVLLGIFAGLYIRFDQWRYEMENRIPESEWRSVRYSPLFDISFPCTPQRFSGRFPAMAIQGKEPQASFLACRRRGLVFDAILLDYPANLPAEEFFGIVRKIYGSSPGTTETPLVWQNLRTGQALTWPGSTGRLFEHSVPALATEAFVAKNSAYLMSTNWDVPSDVRLFFESMHPVDSLR